MSSEIVVDESWVLVSEGTNKFFGRPSIAPGSPEIAEEADTFEDEMMFELSPVYHAVTSVRQDPKGGIAFAMQLFPIEYLVEEGARLTIRATSYLPFDTVGLADRKRFAGMVAAAEKMRTEIRARASGLSVA